MTQSNILLDYEKMNNFVGTYYPFSIAEREYLKKCCIYFDSVEILVPNILDYYAIPEFDRKHVWGYEEREQFIAETEQLRETGIVKLWQPEGDPAFTRPNNEELWWLLEDDDDVKDEYLESQFRRRVSAWSWFLNDAVTSGHIPFTSDSRLHDIFVTSYRDILSNVNDAKRTIYKRKLNFTATSLALDLLHSYLPNFELSSFDDVLEWRELLRDPLRNFRVEMVRLATKIESNPWDEGFEENIQKLIDGEVVPAINDLKAETYSYKQKRISSLIKSTLSLKPLPILATVFVGVPIEISLGLAAGLITLESIYQSRAEEKRIRSNGLSLLVSKHEQI